MYRSSKTEKWLKANQTACISARTFKFFHFWCCRNLSKDTKFACIHSSLMHDFHPTFAFGLCAANAQNVVFILYM